MAIEIVSDSQAMGAYDSMTGKLKQLKSMLMMTYGEPGEAFQLFDTELRENYMWACFSMIEECEELSTQFHPGKRVEVQHV